MAVKSPEKPKSRSELLNFAGRTDAMHNESYFLKQQAEQKRLKFARLESAEYQLNEQGEPYKSPMERQLNQALDQALGYSFYLDTQIPFEHIRVDHGQAAIETAATLGDIGAEVGGKALEATTNALKKGGEVVIYAAKKEAGIVASELGTMLFGNLPSAEETKAKAEADKVKSEAAAKEHEATIRRFRQDKQEAQAATAQNEQAYLLEQAAQDGLSIDTLVQAAGGNQAQKRENVLNKYTISMVKKFMKRGSSKARELITGKKEDPAMDLVMRTINDGKHGAELNAQANAGG